jgi:hypothetical protein
MNGRFAMNEMQKYIHNVYMNNSNSNTKEKDTEDTQQKRPAAYGVLILCILYVVPLGLLYYFIHYQNYSLFSGWVLFIFTLALLYLCNLLFYRIYVMNDITAKIDKINTSTAGYVFGVSFMAHMIVAFTLFAITVYPGLIDVFENTIGMWIISFLGLKSLADEIFYSQVMEPRKKYGLDPNTFNYGFLIAQFNRENVDELIKASQEGCDDENTPFILDFQLRLETQDQVQRLKEMVDTKHSLGHFTWIYLSSVVSLFVSMIALLQKP